MAFAHFNRDIEVQIPDSMLVEKYKYSSEVFITLWDVLVFMTFANSRYYDQANNIYVTYR